MIIVAKNGNVNWIRSSDITALHLEDSQLHIRTGDTSHYFCVHRDYGKQVIIDFEQENTNVNVCTQSEDDGRVEEFLEWLIEQRSEATGKEDTAKTVSQQQYMNGYLRALHDTTMTFQLLFRDPTQK